MRKINRAVFDFYVEVGRSTFIEFNGEDVVPVAAVGTLRLSYGGEERSFSFRSDCAVR